MTLHRFFVNPSLIKAGEVFLPKDISTQIKKVLRLQQGDKFIVLDNTGNEYLIELVSDISGKIISQLSNNNEPNAKITLYQALTARDKFESILQKGTEIGISRFVPIATKRSLLKVKDIKQDRIERFRKIIKEAAEQSERSMLPELHQPMTFELAINEAISNGYVLIAWENEIEEKISEKLKNLPPQSSISIFIGPEGGFERSEIEFAISKKVMSVSLGPRVLRTETAGLVLAALILFHYGELDKNRREKL